MSEPDGVLSEVRGQVAVATTRGRVVSLALEPPQPPGCPAAVDAIRSADWVVLGPGSWFTSVLPHLLVPDIATAIVETPARRMVTLNLAPQPGETSGFSPENHLEVLGAHAPDLRIDVVLADRALGAGRRSAGPGRRAISAPNWSLTDVAVDDGRPVHDPAKLAAAYDDVFTRGRIDAWR